MYIFPEGSQLNSYNETSWDHADYIRLPQKLLSQDRCKYPHDKLAIIQLRFLTIFLSLFFLNSFWDSAIPLTVQLILQQQSSI